MTPSRPTPPHTPPRRAVSTTPTQHSAAAAAAAAAAAPLTSESAVGQRAPPRPPPHPPPLTPTPSTSGSSTPHLRVRVVRQAGQRVDHAHLGVAGVEQRQRQRHAPPAGPGCWAEGLGGTRSRQQRRQRWRRRQRRRRVVRSEPAHPPTHPTVQQKPAPAAGRALGGQQVLPGHASTAPPTLSTPRCTPDHRCSQGRHPRSHPLHPRMHPLPLHPQVST